METRRLPVSYETRRLLTIAAVSLGILWVLADIRFPDRPATPNPMPPVLAQLAPPAPLEDIASSVARLTPRIEPYVVALSYPDAERSAAALRIREDIAVLLLADGVERLRSRDGHDLEVGWYDRASRLAAVRLSGGDVPPPEVWSPTRLISPRYMMAASIAGSSLSIRPVFVASLKAEATPYWPGSVWVPAEPSDLRPGTFMFTTDGRFAGMSVSYGDAVAIVPPESLILAVNDLIARPRRLAGYIGVDAQALTPDIASALGATGGMVVAWVDPRGPAADVLQTADVIERLEGQPLQDGERWKARMLRLAVDDVVRLTVRRGGELREQSIAARAISDEDGRSLGLTLQRIGGAGSRIVIVSPGSAAARAGLQPGDTITRFGAVLAPTPSQISRAFAAAPPDRTLVIAISRADQHLVLTIAKS